MRHKYHLILSPLVAAIFFLFTRSLIPSIICLFVGVFIDLDHLIDFWVHSKKFSFGKDFFDYFYKAEFRKIYLVFHSVELIPFIYFLGNFLFGKSMTYAILLGFIVHLFLDYIGNSKNPFSYFLIYRILVGFDAFKVLGFDFLSED
jgi:hypothetical protein